MSENIFKIAEYKSEYDALKQTLATVRRSL